jgi:hypothetical protein
MIDAERMGTFVASFPVAHEPRATTFVAAGPITFGIEPRVFDPVAEAAKLTAEEIAAAGPDALFHSDQVDSGVCVHVFATDGLAEYLRFDCFNDEPHYHYIVPGRGNMLVHFDRVANGPMLDWTLLTLRGRLPEMLTQLGAEKLAAALKPKELERALDEVQRVASAS